MPATKKTANVDPELAKKLKALKLNHIAMLEYNHPAASAPSYAKHRISKVSAHSIVLDCGWKFNRKTGKFIEIAKRVESLEDLTEADRHLQSNWSPCYCRLVPRTLENEQAAERALLVRRLSGLRGDLLSSLPIPYLRKMREALEDGLYFVAQTKKREEKES